MKGRLASSGYTIVEVMIVLAVSGGLLTSAMALISGQQRRTEFATSVREVESKLQDTFNDVETGFFPNNGNVRCTSAPTAPPAFSVLPSGAVEQGTNQDCIFLGKALQFYENNGLVGSYRIYTIAGKRLYGTAGSIKDVTNIDDAVPRAFYTDDAVSGTTDSNPIELGVLPGGLSVTKIAYIGSADNDIYGLAVLSSIGAGGTAASGERQATNIAPTDGGARLAKLDLHTNANSTNPTRSAIANLNHDSMIDGQNGVIVCMREGGDGRAAAISIGVHYDESSDSLKSSGQRLSTEAYFDDQAERLCN